MYAPSVAVTFLMRVSRSAEFAGPRVRYSPHEGRRLRSVLCQSECHSLAYSLQVRKTPRTGIQGQVWPRPGTRSSRTNTVSATPPASVLSEPRATPAPLAQRGCRTAPSGAIPTRVEASLAASFDGDQPGTSAADPFPLRPRSRARIRCELYPPIRLIRPKPQKKLRPILGDQQRKPRNGWRQSNPPRPAGGVAGAAMAKAPGKFLRGSISRDAPGCDLWLGQSTGRKNTAGNTTQPPPSQHQAPPPPQLTLLKNFW